MPRENESQPVTDMAMESPGPLTMAEMVPDAGIVKDFAVALPGLIAELPGTVGQMIGAASEMLPGRDREAGA